MSMNDYSSVLRFIDRFTGNGARSEIIDAFSNGCCYWFARILWDRFCFRSKREATIVYDPVINHWACEINGRIFDITGDITDNKEYKFENWNHFKPLDPALTKRLYRDCIYYLEEENENVD